MVKAIPKLASSITTNVISPKFFLSLEDFIKVSPNETFRVTVLGEGYEILPKRVSDRGVSTSINSRKDQNVASKNYLNHNMNDLRGNGYVLKL